MDCDPRRWDAYKRQPDPRHVPGLFQYMNMSSEPITELSYMTNPLQSALASMERVYELLDEPEMEAEPEAPKRIGHALGAVEFPTSLWPIIGESTFCFLYPLIFMMVPST